MQQREGPIRYCGLNALHAFAATLYGILPFQTGEPGEVGVRRVQDAIVFEGQRRKVRVRNLVAPGIPGLQHPLEQAPVAVWLASDDLQLMTARYRAGSPEGLFVAAWAAHNAQSHNHNDVGNVLVFADGQPVLLDAGAPTCTAQTFSASAKLARVVKRRELDDTRLARSWGTHLNRLVMQARSPVLKDLWTLRLTQ